MQETTSTPGAYPNQPVAGTVNEFSDVLSPALFAALLLCYGVQAVIAIFKALEPTGYDRNSTRDITLWAVARKYDGGIPNMWTFFVLAIFGPVFLNAIGNMLPLISGGDILDRMSAALYFGCLAAIGVILTLELSYVHNLRKSAREWIPMLVVAIALDIIALLVFFLLVETPHAWPAREKLDDMTRLTMVMTTLLALCSSFLILIFARAAGALDDGKVDLAFVGSAYQSGSEPAEPSRGGTEKRPQNLHGGRGGWWWRRVVSRRSDG